MHSFSHSCFWSFVLPEDQSLHHSRPAGWSCIEVPEASKAQAAESWALQLLHAKAVLAQASAKPWRLPTPHS